MNTTIRNQVTEHKYLGLEISNWKKHIDLIMEETFTRVKKSKKIQIHLYRKTSEQIYLNFIWPILEYVDVIWDNKTLF